MIDFSAVTYNSKFPNPPKFKKCQNFQGSFEVPKYYGFDHPCTKWVLGCIVSNYALSRLLRVAFTYNHILTRYHQIPDIPSLVLKDRTVTDRPAFNQQAILYLTPLSVSIYMKYDDALSQLVNLKDSQGKTLVNPNELNFVQNFWRKGESRYFTDLITTYPAIIAIRRNYFTAFKYLLIAGYLPNASFSLIYRKPHRELIICYKDIIDYVLDYLRKRPAFNVSKLMQVLLQSSKDDCNILDIYCFDILAPTNSNKVSCNDPSLNAISLFQRITRTALDEENMSDENGMHVINILERIQEAGFFHGIPIQDFSNRGRSVDLKFLIQNSTDLKLHLKDLQRLSQEECNRILEFDYKCCVANLIIWFQNKLSKRKTEQIIHLLNLITRILFDTALIEMFFNDNINSDSELFDKLSQLPCLKSRLLENTVIQIRYHINLVYQQSESMIMAFLARYKYDPISMLYNTEANKNVNNKPTWLVSEKIDREFRDKYIKCKAEMNSRTESNKNKSNIEFSFTNAKEVLENSNIINQNVNWNNKPNQVNINPKTFNKNFIKNNIDNLNKTQNDTIKLFSNNHSTARSNNFQISNLRNHNTKVEDVESFSIKNSEKETIITSQESNNPIVFHPGMQSEVILERPWKENNSKNSYLTTIEIDVFDSIKDSSKLSNKSQKGSCTQVLISSDMTNAEYDDSLLPSTSVGTISAKSNTFQNVISSNTLLTHTNSDFPPPLQDKKRDKYVKMK